VRLAATAAARAGAAYEEQVELFRRMINRTPRWHVAERDGHPVEVDGQDAVVFRIEGQWAPYLVDFFTSVRVDSLLKMLTVLEAATGTKAEKAQTLWPAAVARSWAGPLLHQ
jgi:hypothetical protein